jgi:hypothetical protein
LAGAYAFGPVGAPILLHDGPIKGLTPDSGVPGQVVARWSPRSLLSWAADLSQEALGQRWPAWQQEEELPLTLVRPDGDLNVRGYARDLASGGLEPVEIGPPDTSLTRVLAHWMNLPAIRMPDMVHTRDEDGRWRAWSGRWQADPSGWHITIDSRPDLRDRLAEANATGQHVLTHVMQIQRTDRSPFPAHQAAQLLHALHHGVSFAVGRWCGSRLSFGGKGGRA